jgi:IMP dehydrogenase
MEFQESYSFDDLLLLPSYSNILPKDTDTSTEIVKGITIKKPFISAAMDTITESKMAIAMALS